MDGGTIGLEIVDQNGVREQFSIRAYLGDRDGTNSYTSVYVGAIYFSDPRAALVTDSEHTKRMLIHILASAPNKTPTEDHCLMILRKHPFDIGRCLVHKWTGKYDF